jgi:hypothetical protein
MATEEWTRLGQQVDRLITELRTARAEATRWQTRATELESLRLRHERDGRMEEQAKDRELERLRRERKKAIAVVEQIVSQLDVLQVRAQESEELR